MNDRTTASSRFAMREGTVKKNTNGPPTTDRPPPPKAQVAPLAASDASTLPRSAHPLIDAVALAILANSTLFGSPFIDDALQKFNGSSPAVRQNLRVRAKAAIATILRELREPTELMISRGYQEVGPDEVWKAMIDAARGEVGL